MEAINVVIIMNHPNFDSLYHPFMVVLGMVLLLFYPLVLSNIAIEHGHRNSEFSHKKW
jgi:hypothetical protein